MVSAFPDNPAGLSAQAKNLHAWWAGFFAFAIPWCDMLLLPYQVQFTRPLVILAILAWLFSSQAGARVRPLNHALYAMALFILVAPACEENSQARIADRKSTRLNSSHTVISYAVFCLKK